MASLHISLAAEKIGHIGALPITNSLLTAWIVIALLTILSYVATRKMNRIPTGGQLLAETIVGGLYDFFESVVGVHVKKFFPFIATLFIYIVAANWVGLLPGVGTIGFFHASEFTPLFRAATADLNMTIGLAILSIIAMQYFGFKTLGFHYSGRFISLKDPISFAVGLLEIISDFSKVLSFGFRLFGNIFAGEVLLAVIAFIMPYIVPLPFLVMELFVGLIQALVFSMLSAAFLHSLYRTGKMIIERR